MSTKTIRPVTVGQQFKFCPEIVFDAWLQPEFIAKWLFVGPGSKIIRTKIDAVPGGNFSILEEEQATRRQLDHFGMYKQVERPYRLAFTLSVPEHFAGETEVTVAISPRPGGCELHVTQTGVPQETTEKDWRNMLDKLNTVLKEMAKKTL